MSCGGLTSSWCAELLLVGLPLGGFISPLSKFTKCLSKFIEYSGRISSW
jgi:hypothetical protein